MKALVIYTSQTGFTKKYANWLAEKLNGQAMTIAEAQQKEGAFFDSFDAIVFGGWAKAGKIVDLDWFLSRITSWKEKKLAIFMVGASPNESPDIPKALETILNEEEKQYAKVFYCQGGLNYEKMPLSSKLMMKGFAMVMKKKDPKIGEILSRSYDISDEKYLEPIILYLQADL